MTFPISYNTNYLFMPPSERKKQVTAAKKSKGVEHGYFVKAKIIKS